MTTPTGVDPDVPTLADIDEALVYLRETLHALDGAPIAQARVHEYVDDLLDQRLALVR